MMLMLRTNGNLNTAQEAALKLVTKLDKSLPVQVSNVGEHLAAVLLPARAGALLLGMFGALGLLLASIGLGGMMVYVVAQRTREIGVRMALGATRTDVLALVVVQAMKLTGIGCAVGLTTALGATQTLRVLLYGVSPADPVTFIGVVLILMVVTLLTAYVPARRASRIDPMVALRYE